LLKGKPKCLNLMQFFQFSSLSFKSHNDLNLIFFLTVCVRQTQSNQDKNRRAAPSGGDKKFCHVVKNFKFDEKFREFIQLVSSCKLDHWARGF
jgi:hypothetical protein